MPHIISNPGSRQSHPLYTNKCGCIENTDGTKGMEREMSPEKTESIPKTYDAIKNAAEASAHWSGGTKPMRRK